MSEALNHIVPLDDERDRLVVSLAEKVRAVMTERGLSLQQAADESGIAKGTLQPWLKGEYKGVAENIDSKAEKWLNSLSARDRVRRAMPSEPKFLLTPSALMFTSVFQFAQGSPDIGLITGDAGVGKTMAARAYQSDNANVWILTADASMRSPTAVLNELSDIIGLSGVKGHRKMAAIIRRLIDTNGLLIIDEAQNFSTESIDLLRTIYDRAAVGIVFMGNEPLKGRVEGLGRDKRFAQIFSRVGMRKNQTRPRIKDVDQVLSAWGIDDPSLRKLARFVAMQPGGLRGMNKTLRFALMQSGAGVEDLREAHFQRAWQELTGAELHSVERK